MSPLHLLSETLSMIIKELSESFRKFTKMEFKYFEIQLLHVAVLVLEM